MFVSFQQNLSVSESLNQFPFYLLPMQKQKMLSLVLKRLQHGVKVQMGPFAELNYETATKVRFIKF